MSDAQIRAYVDRTFDETVVPTITEYIRIPNKSPAFDKDWEAAGHMQKAVDLVAGWCRAQPIPGLRVQVEKLPGRTPLIFMEIPGTTPAADTVMLYGHLDKQPEMTGWSEGLSPWTPVRKGDLLYGRGGADDGYAAFSALTAIAALAAEKRPYARCVVLIEASEESGSPDLPFYIEALEDKIGPVSLVVCLDSGCGNYEQLWCTTSLRGLAGFDLKVSLLKEGVHSGYASGMIASSFRVMRMLLSRLEDENTGKIRLPELEVEIPADRRAQAKLCADVLGRSLVSELPTHPGVKPMHDDLVDLLLARTWRPALSITGVDGIPAMAQAGNVLRPQTTLKLSLRLPPTLDPEHAKAVVEKRLLADPPYGAKVEVKSEAGPGWNAPSLAPWLEGSIRAASETHFGKPPVYMGEGGSIPFMGMLGKRYPKAQFMITGVLGPGSNAHGPNEFLHIPMAKKLTASVAQVVADHFRAGHG